MCLRHNILNQTQVININSLLNKMKISGSETVHRQDSSPTRILETVHRQNWRQFTDIFEDKIIFGNIKNQKRIVAIFKNCQTSISESHDLTGDEVIHMWKCLFCPDSYVFGNYLKYLDTSTHCTYPII